MVVGNIRTQREAGDLGIVPVNRKGDGRIAQDTEVEGVVGVFPDVIATEDKVLAHSLLETGVKLVAETRLKRARDAWRTEKQRRQHRIRASLAGKHQVLVKRRFQGAGIGNAQYRAGSLEVIGHADARLRLASNRQTVVEVSAHADIEEPVTRLDLVLNIERQLLHIGVAEVVIISYRRG